MDAGDRETLDAAASILDAIVERLKAGEITGPPGAVNSLASAAASLRTAGSLLDEETPPAAPPNEDADRPRNRARSDPKPR